MSTVLGIIGSQEIRSLEVFQNLQPKTSANGVELRVGSIHGTSVVFTLRAGSDQPTIPSFIDYTAVMHALDEEGCSHILSTAMVGSLRPALPIGHQTVLTQFLDFTRQRQFTFFPDESGNFDFVDMTDPFCPALNQRLARAGESVGVAIADAACYVGVEGPRFETRAEVAMYNQLGGDVIGGTILPEVVIAREAGKCYATFAGVVNLGAGLSAAPLDAQDFRRYRTEHASTFATLVERITRDWDDEARLTCTCPKREA